MGVIRIGDYQRNPAQNWQVNPARNWQINPARNWQINPARNWQINPARNWQINPARNWQINPARNWQINPARNWQINPARNWQVNPTHNWQINPNQSASISGVYVIDINKGESILFGVWNEKKDVLLFFDSSFNFIFFAPLVSSIPISHAPVFSSDTYAYIGYLCSNAAGGFNWFTLTGEWIYYTT